MEIKLMNKETPVWIEEEPISNRAQISLEAVIPDSREDAARVVWTQGGVLLKGREASAHSFRVTGEVWVSVLYQTDSGGLDTLRLRKEYEQSFELEEPDPDAPPQIQCRLAGLEGKLLNPRKLGVSADIQTVLQPFRRGTLSLDTSLPEEAGAFVHLLREQRDVLALKTVQEKSFTIREQLQPMNDTALPRSIAGESLSFSRLETESLGTRSIVKGEAELRIWGLNEVDTPVSASFCLPFSQLAEIGSEDASLILAQAEPSSVYLDWVEGVGGQRSLDAEVHGVLQLRSYTGQKANYVTDAYSTRMPSAIRCGRQRVLGALERSTALLSAEETLPVPEDAAEILAAEAKLGLLENDREHLSLPLTLDLLYRSTDGTRAAIRRSVHLEGAPAEPSARCLAVRLKGCKSALENGKLKLQAQAEVQLERKQLEEYDAVSALELKEDEAWDPSETPALSLVLPHGESLWELAREYRSSVEAIAACNPEGSSMLLIPAE